ncbi:hypothetical protein Ssi03_00640 [Sphaerisporangium siamense]|nr:hypothetical protein Ssi03_00640 [Sphaerisporangium siamense]
MGAPAALGQDLVELRAGARPEHVEAFVQARDVPLLLGEFGLTDCWGFVIIDSNVKLRACFAIWAVCDDKGSG